MLYHLNRFTSFSDLQSALSWTKLIRIDLSKPVCEQIRAVSGKFSRKNISVTFKISFSRPREDASLEGNNRERRSLARSYHWYHSWWYKTLSSSSTTDSCWFVQFSSLLILIHEFSLIKDSHLVIWMITLLKQHFSAKTYQRLSTTDLLEILFRYN